MPTTSQFQAELSRMIDEAQRKGLPYIDIQSGILHRRVGDYPNPQKHRMPICCAVMRQNMQRGDTILRSPLKGNGATLVIRYRLPRQ